MTVLLLGFLWRDARVWFWRYLPVGLGLLLSTLYLRTHYLVDVIAGALVAVVAIALAGPMHAWWFRASPSMDRSGMPELVSSGLAP
jgi:membrane-associated phospholipid phosphatase